MYLNTIVPFMFKYSLTLLVIIIFSFFLCIYTDNLNYYLSSIFISIFSRFSISFYLNFSYANAKFLGWVFLSFSIFLFIRWMFKFYESYTYFVVLFIAKFYEYFIHRLFLLSFCIYIIFFPFVMISIHSFTLYLKLATCI